MSLPPTDASEAGLFDSDIHVYPSEVCPLAPFLPANLRLAVKLGMDTQPWNGYRNPHGVNRRDVQCVDAASLAALHLDPLRVAHGVLQPQEGLYVGLVQNIDVANGLATAWNDWQRENYLTKDSRLLGSACINAADPFAAAREIRRIAGDARFVQVVVPGEAPFLYGHRFYDPLFEACVETGLVFALHPGHEGALSSSTPVGRPASYFEWHTTLPLTYQAHLASMVCEGLFERFPALRVMLVEGGFGWLPHLVWRMEKNFKALRATAPRLRRLPSEYVFDHVWFTSQPMEEPAQPAHLVAILEMVHARHRLCFSSDFPHWDFDDPGRVLPSQVPVEWRPVSTAKTRSTFIPAGSRRRSRRRLPRMSPSPSAHPSAEVPATLMRAFAETASGFPRSRESQQVLNAGPADTLADLQCRIIPHGKTGIGVYRVNDRLYAVRNQCPHMGAPLCKGRLGATYLPKGAAPDPFEETLANRVLRCPWHGWEFDIATGKGLYDAKGRVPTYPVRINTAREIEVLV